MCWWLFKKQSTEQRKPQIELLQVPSQNVKVEVDALKLKLLYPTLLDNYEPYYYTKAEDWAEVFDWIYFKFDMPSYLSARMDCEDFAILLKGLVSAFFGLNYFGTVMGNTPSGYHAWNLFRTEDELWQFEPQTGLYFPIGEEGYQPQYVLL